MRKKEEILPDYPISLLLVSLFIFSLLLLYIFYSIFFFFFFIIIYYIYIYVYRAYTWLRPSMITIQYMVEGRKDSTCNSTLAQISVALKKAHICEKQDLHICLLHMICKHFLLISTFAYSVQH